MTSIIDMKNPHKLLNALASKPMSKWEIKQTAKMQYPRIHEAMSLLEKDGYVKSFDTITSKRGRDMKIYGLTFKGIIAHLSTISIIQQQEKENLTESEINETDVILIEPSIIDPLRKDESIETSKARHEKEREHYLKELEKIAVFLETYGKILDYALFTEIRWLKERYGYEIFRSLIFEAKLVNALQPFPSGAMQLIKLTQREVNKLKKRKWFLLREPEVQKETQTTILEGGKIVKTDYYDPIKEVNERIKKLEEQLRILRVKENSWWSRGFASRFAEEYCSREGKGDMHNEALCRLFEQVAEEIKLFEVEPVEGMAKVFS